MPARRPEHYAMLLRVRKRQEEIRAQALAEAQRIVNRTQTEQREIADTQKRTVEEATIEVRTLVSPGRVSALLRYERHLASLSVRKDAELIEARRIAGERREALSEAMLLRKTIDRLIEKARLRQMADALVQERRAMDETASIRAALSRAVASRRRKEES